MSKFKDENNPQDPAKKSSENTHQHYVITFEELLQFMTDFEYVYTLYHRVILE